MSWLIAARVLVGSTVAATGGCGAHAGARQALHGQLRVEQAQDELGLIQIRPEDLDVGLLEMGLGHERGLAEPRDAAVQTTP